MNLWWTHFICRLSFSHFSATEALQTNFPADQSIPAQIPPWFGAQHVSRVQSRSSEINGRCVQEADRAQRTKEGVPARRRYCHIYLCCSGERSNMRSNKYVIIILWDLHKSRLYGVNSVYIQQVIPSIMYAGIGITLFEMMWKESPWMYWFWECISPY